MPRIALALLSGVALALSFEPFRIVVLLPVAVAVFLCCVHGRSLRSGALLGLLLGLAFWHVHIFWMRVVGVEAWLGLSLFMTAWFVLLGVALAAVSRLPGWPVWSALAWVAIEVLRGAYPMSGFTWGRLVFATIDTPYAGWLPWVGANGVSLLVALTAAALAWVALRLRSRWSTRGRRDGLVAGGLLVATAVAVVLPGLVTWSGEDVGSARVAVVQGDVPGDGDDLLAYHREVTRSHLDLTDGLADDVDAGRAERPDFVVWPENSTAVDPFRDDEFRSALRDASASLGVPILVGGVVDGPEDGEVLNQGIVFDPVQGAGDRYTKRHPVPFGEYIPYREKLGIESNFSQLSQVPRDMLSGTRTAPLRIGDTLVADAICFDVSYDDAIADQVRGGAELLTVQTSNAFFIHTGQIEQQFAITRLRALETGRTVVIASVNGRSGFIAPDGSVRAGIEPRTRAVLARDVPLVGGTPPAMVVGPWLGRASVVLALGALVAALLPYPRRRVAPHGANQEIGRRTRENA